MARRYHTDGDEEFSDRENLGELPSDSYPGEQLPPEVMRPTLPPSRAPSGTPPSAPGGIPYGRFFQKRYRQDFGQPFAPTGGIAAPVQTNPDGSPRYDEAHPMPAQLPRECWDYFFNLLRQMLVKVEKPTWIEPPARAKPIDECSSGHGVPLAPLGPPIAITPAFVIPSGSLGFITRIGVSISQSSEWGNVHFHLRKNGVDVDKYGDFTLQIGSPEEPSLLAAPLELRPRDTVQIFANTTGILPVFALGRAFGWHFPTQVLTSDGSFRERIVD